MTPRPNAARIGFFALGGVALLVAALALVFGARLFARTERVVMHFSGSVYGLQVGAPVVFRGVRLGSVRSIGVVHGSGGFGVPVVAEIDRSMIRDLQGNSLEGEPLLALPALVQRGLSAQLAQQSLLTGLLYVDLDLRPGAQRAAQGAAPPRSGIALGAPLVEIPTTRSRVQSLQDQLEGVDLARMAQDLAGTLAAARALLSGPQLRQTLDETAKAATALARLGQALEARVAPLADGAQQTLVVAGQAAERVGRAADRTTAAADRVNAAAARADTLLAPGSPLLASMQRTADELARSASALRQAVADDAATVQGAQQALEDVSRAARAVRELAAQLEQQPQMLLLGRPGAP